MVVGMATSHQTSEALQTQYPGRENDNARGDAFEHRWTAIAAVSAKLIAKLGILSSLGRTSAHTNTTPNRDTVMRRRTPLVTQKAQILRTHAEQ